VENNMSKHTKYLLPIFLLAGLLSACGGGGGGTSNNAPNGTPAIEAPAKIELHNVLYMTANDKSSPVVICNFNQTGITSCQNSGAKFDDADASLVDGIVINQSNTFAYVTTGNDIVYRCNINQTDGTLSACNGYPVPGLGNTRSPAINGSHIYFSSVFNSSIFSCTIENDGSLSDCDVAYMNEKELAGPLEAIKFDNNSNLFVNTQTDIAKCHVATDGTISSCENAGYTYPHNQNVRGLQFNPDFSQLYIVGTWWENTNMVVCDSTKPLLSNCGNGWANPGNPGLPLTIQAIPGNGQETRLWLTDMEFTTSNYVFISTASYTQLPAGDYYRTGVLYACQLNAATGLLVNCAEQSNDFLNNLVPPIGRMAIIN
jgi:hypothetical protein